MDGENKILRHVSDAQCSDDKGNYKDAYLKYLQSTILVTQHILNCVYAASGTDLNQHKKLIGLVVMCVQRAEELINNKIDSELLYSPETLTLSPIGIPTTVAFLCEKCKATMGLPAQSSTSSSLPAQSPTTSSLPAQSPTTSSLPAQSPTSSSLPAQSPTSSSLPAQPSTSSSRLFQSVTGTTDHKISDLKKDFPSSRLNALEIAEKQNRQLMVAYKARMSGVSRHTATDLSLGLQRRLAENLAVAKARQEALAKKRAERRIRQEAEVSRRVTATMGMCEDELERRRFYTSVLEFEHDNKWLLPWRQKLKQHPEDCPTIQELINVIIRTSKHPLTLLLQSCQRKVYDVSMTLLRQWQCTQSPESATVLPPGGHSLARSDTPNTPSGYNVTDSGNNVTDSGYNVTDFDDLFEDDDGDDDPDMGHSGSNNDSSGNWDTTKSYQNTLPPSEEHTTSHDPSNTPTSADLVNNTSCDNAPSTSIENVSLCELEKEARMQHLLTLTHDIQDYIERLVTMCMVVYESLDHATGRDLCYSSIEEAFYLPLWSHILGLFRVVHQREENKLVTVMTAHCLSDPSELKVPRKFCLLPEDSLLMPEAYQPYQAAVTELVTLTRLTAPLPKLECIVQVSRTICKCVEEFYANNKAEIPNIGADDLLPLLSYVVVRTQLPQLLSECYALEELVHEGYLMGEEGYCLTSLETALKYIITLN